MGDNNKKKLNIAILPWLSFGHFIPFLQLSQQLAILGHHIYFISTPKNLQHLPKIPPFLSHLITLIPLPMPKIQKLPQNAESTSDLGFELGTNLLKQAMDELKYPLTNFLETSEIQFDWIVYDFCYYWVPNIADNFKIKKVFFSIYFARSIVAFGSNLGKFTWNDVSTPPPWIPFPKSSVYFLPHEAKNLESVIKIKSSGVSDFFRLIECIKGCDVLAIRSCIELEDDYLKLVEKIENKFVLPLGLLPSLMEEVNSLDENWNSINGWLNNQKKGSVVYVAFGSEFELSQDQLTELAHGLELSGLPFFWAFRKSSVSKVEFPEGFEDRTRDQGVVWRKWVSQTQILSHNSVGGFVTHCGWSSIIEGLQFGKPLIMLPLAIDHGFYARFMVEKKVGIEIPRNVEDGSFTRIEACETIKEVIESENGKIYRDEAKKLSCVFGDKKLHGEYVEKFSDYLCQHKPNREGNVKHGV